MFFMNYLVSIHYKAKNSDLSVVSSIELICLVHSAKIKIATFQQNRHYKNMFEISVGCITMPETSFII